MSRLTNPLLFAAKEYETSPAVIYENRIIGYSDYAIQINNLILSLIRLGVKPKMSVAFISANRYEELLLILSLIYIGAIACPLSNRYPGQMLNNLLKTLKPDFYLSASDYSFNNMHSGNLNELQNFNPEDDATIIFTSGTSAVPKGAVHTFANHYYSALGSNDNIKLVPSHRWILSLPLYHIGGLAIIFRTLISGAALVIPDANESLEDSINKYNVTHISLVPTQLKRLLGSKADISSLKAVLLGGDTVPPTLIKKGLDLGLPLYTSYGLTEMGSQVTTTQPDDSFGKLKTSGRPLKYRELKIGDGSEILVKGKTLLKKYTDNQEPFDNKGWFHTGDIGSIDKDGSLSVIGRKNNMFISGGENIHPEQIENSLKQIKQIDEAIIVPVDDIEFGQRPAAFIKSNDPDFDFDSIDLQIEKFKRPVKYFKWPKDYEQKGIKPDRVYFTNLAGKLQKQTQQ